MSIKQTIVKSTCGAQNRWSLLLVANDFDRYANSHSLLRPQDAVVFLSPLLLKQEGEAIASIELKKNRKRTTHHRSAELNIKIKYLTRLKTNQRIKLANGGPPPYFGRAETGMIGFASPKFIYNRLCPDNFAFCILHFAFTIGTQCPLTPHS